MEVGSADSSADQSRDFKWWQPLAVKAPDIIQTAIRCGAFVAMVYILYLTITPFAGEDSVADISLLLEIVTDLHLDDAIPWALAGGSSLWAYKERKLRRNDNERLSSRLKKYEEAADPGRQSSGLAPKGLTNPGD